MVLPQQLSLIVDDQSSGITYGGGQWTTSSLSAWYNGTSVFPAFAVPANSRLYGNLSMSFQGTSIAFFGNTPPGSQTVIVSIDNQPQYNTSYDDPTPQSYRQWYTTPNLPDGDHHISLSHIAGTSIDFAVITVGPNTPIKGQKVIVDNDDPAIQYKGSWTRNTDEFNAGPLPDGYPFHNSTHESNTVGDSLTFRFSGSSAAIYGVFPWSTLGLLRVTYTLDGATLGQTYSVSPSSIEFINNADQQSNFLFFSYDSLDSTEHTLVIDIVQNMNLTFAFDYITYTPTFGTLKDMPDSSAGASANTTSSSSTIPPPISTTSSTISSSSSSSKTTPVGGVVGGVIGGGIFIIVLIGVLWYYLRRQRYARYRLENEKPHNVIHPFTFTENTSTIDQYPDPSMFTLSSTSGSVSVRPSYGYGYSTRYNQNHLTNNNSKRSRFQTHTMRTASSSQNLRTLSSSQDIRTTTSSSTYPQSTYLSDQNGGESSSRGTRSEAVDVIYAGGGYDQSRQDGEIAGVAPPAYDDVSTSLALAGRRRNKL